jgi:predicted transcriptional regulator
MTGGVETCSPQDSLATAAQRMCEADCGVLPVVRDGRVVGMITDRDICIAAFKQGGPLSALAVASAMAREICSCRPEDSIPLAEGIMRAHQVRRLPVVDPDGRLVGILTVNDIGRHAVREHLPRSEEPTAVSFAETMAAICEPRRGNPERRSVAEDCEALCTAIEGLEPFVALDEEARRAKAHALHLARGLIPRIADLERRAARTPVGVSIPLPVAALRDRVAWLDAEVRKLRERADRAEALARRAGA